MDVNLNTPLPPPDPSALAQSEALSKRIREEIHEEGGTIGFQRYMERVLYEPGLGYYSSALEKFGAAGDFITAPEISPLFGRCMAVQVGEILAQIEGGDILELGGGTGKLAATILADLEASDHLPEHYYLIELSAFLRQRQEETLMSHVPHLMDRVQWLDRWPDSGFRGVVLANEVLDAMPVQCFTLSEGEVFERRVTTTESGFAWQDAPAAQSLSEQVRYLIPEPVTGVYHSEWNPWLKPWLAGLAQMMELGVVLFVDYGYERAGYYHPGRREGTLICHYRHHVHDDPFFLPGLQDITASVDFTLLAEAAADHGLQVSGYTHQSAFLFGNGLQEIYEGLSDQDGLQDRVRLAHEIRQLTLPGEMGERFRVMALSNGYDLPLRGFSWQDHRARL
jgi:SAM-dependent MidA family methyltransferase